MLNSYFNEYRWRATGAQAYLLVEAQEIPGMLTVGLIPLILFAVLCAMAVFGYLYNHRSACWTHALPLRREALFTTQYLAGLSFLILPILAAGVLTAVVEVSFLPMGEWGGVLSILLTWLLAQCGLVIFFFSFASFCAMFTGHILALPAFYCILNCLAYGLWYLVDNLMNEFYYGYVGVPGALETVEYLTPAVALRDAVRWGYGEEGNLLRAPDIVLIYTLVGVALAFVSLCVYRRRHVETAGDVVAVAVVRPLFKYGVSFCSGLAFGMFTAAFFGWADLPVLIPCILIWAVVGYFAAEMLLKKSFRVWKAWKGGAVMAAVMLALCLVCLADIFGIVNRVPAPERVESVLVHIQMGYPYDNGRILDATLTDPEQIAKVTALHRAVVDNRDNQEYNDGHTSDSDYASVYLYYDLTNGRELDRRYTSVPIHAEDLEEQGSVLSALEQILDDRTLVAMAYNFEGFMKNSRLTTAYVEGLLLNGEDHGPVYLDSFRQELWDAVQADFAEGNIGVRWPFEYSRDHREHTYNAYLTFEVSRNYSEVAGPADNPDVYYETRPANDYLRITLTPQAKHTLAVLDQAGLFEEGYSLAAYEPDDSPDTHTW